MVVKACDRFTASVKDRHRIRASKLSESRSVVTFSVLNFRKFGGEHSFGGLNIDISKLGSASAAAKILSPFVISESTKRSEAPRVNCEIFWSTKSIESSFLSSESI